MTQDKDFKRLVRARMARRARPTPRRGRRWPGPATPAGPPAACPATPASSCAATAGLVGSALRAPAGGRRLHQRADRHPRPARPARPGRGELLVPGQPARVRVPRGGHGRRHHRQLHPPGRVPLRQHDDPRHRGARQPPVRRAASCCTSGQLCIYPRDAAQPITEDQLLTGPLEPTNEALRAGQDRRHQAVRGLPQPVRRRLLLGHAHQPLRPGRQLRPRRSATSCRCSSAASTRPASGGDRGRRVGHGHARGASSCTSTTWPTPACS